MDETQGEKAVEIMSTKERKKKSNLEQQKVQIMKIRNIVTNLNCITPFSLVCTRKAVSKFLNILFSLLPQGKKLRMNYIITKK